MRTAIYASEKFAQRPNRRDGKPLRTPLYWLMEPGGIEPPTSVRARRVAIATIDGVTH
jgi:hypothetical protein